MPRRMDIWRCAVVHKEIERLLAEGIGSARIDWLPELGASSFLADPFGWHANGYLQLFVERFDYRTRHGVIDRITLDDQGHILETRPALREPWHLSYPVVFEGEGAMWMLPEAWRSGRLTLYRGDEQLADWKAETRIDLDCLPVDATPLWHNGEWWLFYSPAANRVSKTSHLHVAWAKSLHGPWTVHPGNPVRIDRSSARPGGRAVVSGGRIMLPVQDCSDTYGGRVRPLWINRLDAGSFEAEAGAPLSLPADAGAYRDGMHTLSACGAVTLIDVKRIDSTGRGLWIDLRRALRPAG
jgi:hypothetical protein